MPSKRDPTAMPRVIEPEPVVDGRRKREIRDAVHDVHDEERPVIVRGAALKYADDRPKRSIVRMPCACAGDECACGAARLFGLIWDAKVEEIAMPSSFECPSWLDPLLLPRLQHLERLHRRVHSPQDEEEEVPKPTLSEANRAALETLLAAFRSLSPRRRWLLARSLDAAGGAEAPLLSRTFLITSRCAVDAVWQFPAASVARPPTGRLHATQVRGSSFGGYSADGQVTQEETRGRYRFQEWYKRSKRPLYTNPRRMCWRPEQPSKSALKTEQKREEERQEAVRAAAPIAQFVREPKPTGHQKPRRSNDLPAHSKRQVEHEWKLPAALMTYEEPLDFDSDDEAEDAPFAPIFHSPLTVGDFLLHNNEPSKRSFQSSLSDGFVLVELLDE
ncbi:hypothetical protein M3Y99_01134000 [Aphelenchoides fujianensis]|nr:hypothetical protein M3Y99_01134000 [Aphelenchoides fujianensis]